MEFKKQLVTPSIAKQYLEANIKNRTVRMPVVLRYAQDMKEGRWKEDTAELIKISKTGVVLDGQHRLYAVIKANIPVYLHVAIGVPDEVFDVLDTGATRNATDVFGISGVLNNNILPSIMQTYFALKNNRQAIAYTGGRQNKRLTNAELLQMFFNNEAHWVSVGKKAKTWYTDFAKILPPSLVGGVYALLYEIDEEDAVLFMGQMCNGINIQNNTIAILRQTLMKDKMSARRVDTTTKLAYIIKTWNFFRKKTDVKFIKYVDSQESFPTPI
jgi:hypothetical protein